MGGGAGFSRVSLSKENHLSQQMHMDTHNEKIHTHITRSFAERSCPESGRRAVTEQRLPLARNKYCRTDNQHKGNAIKQRTLWLDDA